MSRRSVALAVVSLAVATAGVASTAEANGRFPTSTSVTMRPGDGDDLYLGVTFGLLISHDDGWHWQWLCEQSIGYGGDFDPKYEVSADGTIYATTFDGLRVSTDGGCTFVTATAPPGGGGELVDIWVDAIDVATDGTVWLGTAESGLPNAVYRSTDRGITVEKMGLDSKTIWWKSLRIARSDQQRIYVSGYQVAPTQAVFIERSIDGGAGWEEMPVTDIVLGSQPLVLILGVDPINADVVFARSVGAVGPKRDRLYRSDDGGQTWTGVLDTDKPIRAFTIRSNGDVIVGSVEGLDPVAGCTYRSTDRGVTFTACENGPQMACLGERDDGQLFACGANWDPDYFSLARSDGAPTWNKVFRFHEMAGPLECPEGTAQHDMCELVYWPPLREQFGVTGAVDGGPSENPPDAATTTEPPPGSCCDVGGGGPASLALAGLVALGLAGVLRRRRV